MDGVEFLSLPPLCYYRGEAQPSIRAVLGSKRWVRCNNLLSMQKSLDSIRSQGFFLSGYSIREKPKYLAIGNRGYTNQVRLRGLN
jgi:hypothetical protein